MTNKTCAAADCGRPADYRVYPHDDPDLMNEGWYVCEEHVEWERQRGHGVERDVPWGST